MSRIDPQVVRAIHDERLARDLEARIALAQAALDRPSGLRRLVGRSLVAAGSRLAAEPPPRPARSS